MVQIAGAVPALFFMNTVPKRFNSEMNAEIKTALGKHVTGKPNEKKGDTQKIK